MIRDDYKENRASIALLYLALLPALPYTLYRRPP